MRFALRNYICTACAALTLAAAPSLRAAQPSAAPSAAQQAVSVVTKHYLLNPFALDPKTGQALPHDAPWSVATTPPPLCAQTPDKCVEVIYQVPAESVRCAWTVLLNADGSDGAILDQNDDAEHYLLRKLSPDEAKAQVIKRMQPVYPPIAILAQINGDVVLSVVVGKAGEVQKVVPASGPPIVQGAAIDAAKHWTFKPLMVGARAVPYAIQLKLMFRAHGNQNSVYTEP